MYSIESRFRYAPVDTGGGGPDIDAAFSSAKIQQIGAEAVGDVPHEGIRRSRLQMTPELEAILQVMPEHEEGVLDMVRYGAEILEPSIIKLVEAGKKNDKDALFWVRNGLVIQKGMLHMDLMRGEDSRQPKQINGLPNPKRKLSGAVQRIMAGLSSDNKLVLVNTVIDYLFKAMDDDDGQAAHKAFLDILEPTADEASFVSTALKKIGSKR